jgi:hypothetical protein
MNIRHSLPVVTVAALAAACGLLPAVPGRAQVPVPTAPPTASAPACHTVDAFGQPATLFAPGDKVIVKGEGFGQVTAIRVTFVQGTRTLPVVVTLSDELGVFSADRGDPRIPSTAAPGPASMHAFSASRVATCAVQVMAAAGGSATPKPRKPKSLLVTAWWVVLAVFGLFLLVVLIRRWRARRLTTSVEKRVEPQVPRLPDTPLILRPVEDDDLEPVSDFGDEPPILLPEETELEPEPAAEPAPPPEFPVLDPVPEAEPAPLSTSELGPAPSAPPPANGEEEFIFRDGKWRLRDELSTGRVDVAEASVVADAFHVPALRRRPDDEPPLLDPVPIEDPIGLDTELARPPEVITVNGTVSDTVARLVENTKDWTKR